MLCCAETFRRNREKVGRERERERRGKLKRDRELKIILILLLSESGDNPILGECEEGGD